MARSQENSITMLLGLKDRKVGEIVRGDDRVTVKITIDGGGRDVLIVTRQNCMGMVCAALARYCIPG